MPTRLKKREERRLSKNLGQSMRAARNRLGFTQQEAAVVIGIATEVYGRMERGIGLPSVPMLVAMCKALGVEPSNLLGDQRTNLDALPAVPLARAAEALPDIAESRRLLRALARLQLDQLRLVLRIVNEFLA